MLGNLPVRFGVGGRVKLPGLHHVNRPPRKNKNKIDVTAELGLGVWSVECGVWSVECGVWSDAPSLPCKGYTLQPRASGSIVWPEYRHRAALGYARALKIITALKGRDKSCGSQCSQSCGSHCSQSCGSQCSLVP